MSAPFASGTPERERLERLLAIPSISADPASGPAMADARALLADWLAAIGFERIEELDGGGHPALTAEWLHAPGRPTLLVYGHYDVQPPDPLALWESPPFVPTEREGRLYARGASDDKGPVAAALVALERLMAETGRLPVNVKILLEGEEEVGSRTLGALLERHRERLSADACLSADGARWRADTPSVNVGTRGIAALDFTVRTAAKDLHSGRYGGIAPNAAQVAARLVASLHREDGSIAVAGFCDDVVAPDAAERAAADAFPLDAEALMRAAGGVPAGDARFSPVERLWFRPTLEINGIFGGYAGPGSKTVIPAEAGAKITMRLAPGQDPARARDLVEAHLIRHCPPHATLAVHQEEGGVEATRLPPDHWLLAAVEESLADEYARPPVRLRIGATLPITALFSRILGIETVMLSCSTADEDFHAPNEHIRLSGLAEGVALWRDVLERLGRANSPR